MTMLSRRFLMAPRPQKGNAFNMKTVRKTWVISCDAQGVVTEVDHIAFGEK